ncbi:hypothetical protein OSTOST_26075 [Ostertagia ostertagi]
MSSSSTRGGGGSSVSSLALQENAVEEKAGWLNKWTIMKDIGQRWVAARIQQQYSAITGRAVISITEEKQHHDHLMHYSRVGQQPNQIYIRLKPENRKWIHQEAAKFVHGNRVSHTCKADVGDLAGWTAIREYTGRYRPYCSRENEPARFGECVFCRERGEPATSVVVTVTLDAVNQR